MEELPDTEEMRRMRKEQEREKRRLRDRERRQSMSIEERERHLARRRRNYQLRRQKAETTRLDSQIHLMPIGEILTSNQENDAVITSASDSSWHSNGAAVLVVSDQGLEILNPEYKRHESMDVPAQKLAKLTGSLRLNRLKHLARTLNKSGGELSIDGHKIKPDFIAKSNRTSNCALSGGLRLNRIKRLARTLNSIKENGSQGLVKSKPAGMEDGPNMNIS